MAKSWLPKLNIIQETRGLLERTVRGGLRQAAASSIPFYNFFEDQVVPLINRNKGEALGRRADATVVDQYEIKDAFDSLDYELGGTYNPVFILYNAVRRFFGSSSAERAQGELNVLKEYSGLYDNYLFANDSMKFLKSKLHQRISRIEGGLSKLGLRVNKKVNKDKLVNSLKSAFKAWASTPAEQVLSGGVKGASLYQADIDFYQELSDDLSFGKHSEYLKDLAADVNRVLRKIKQQQQKQAAAKQAKAQQQQRRPGRDLAQSLASAA